MTQPAPQLPDAHYVLDYTEPTDHDLMLSLAKSSASYALQLLTQLSPIQVKTIFGSAIVAKIMAISEEVAVQEQDIRPDGPHLNLSFAYGYCNAVIEVYGRHFLAGRA